MQAVALPGQYSWFSLICGREGTYFDCVEPFAEAIVFKVEQLEAGMDVFDQRRQTHGRTEVGERDAVDCETREFVDHVDSSWP